MVRRGLGVVNRQKRRAGGRVDAAGFPFAA
jgi:hypothetical protein